VTINN